MSNGSELKSPAAKALRAAGYMPLPRLWVKAEDLDLVVYMAKQHESEVNRIRAEANQKAIEGLTREQQIELAWSKRNSCR